MKLHVLNHPKRLSDNRKPIVERLCRRIFTYVFIAFGQHSPHAIEKMASKWLPLVTVSIVGQFPRQHLFRIFLALTVYLLLTSCGGPSGQSGQQVIAPEPPLNAVQPVDENKSNITVISGKA